MVGDGPGCGAPAGRDSTGAITTISAARPASIRNAARIDVASATKPISERSIQRGLQQVVTSLGWKIPGLCVHTLRHSYATAMLEEGVNLKVLQTYLGHKNLQATEVYLHLTRRGDERARRIVKSIMNGPPTDTPPQQEDRQEHR